MTQPFLFSDGAWVQVRDGNLSGFAIFRRHYSCANFTPKIRQFMAPGEKLALLTPDVLALFCWRKSLYRADGQIGINCSVFRNEGAGLSSQLIRAADDIAWERWPGERHFTFVDPRRVRSTNPGYCFMMAGWKKCGISKGGLVILDIFPAA